MSLCVVTSIFHVVGCRENTIKRENQSRKGRRNEKSSTPKVNDGERAKMEKMQLEKQRYKCCGIRFRSIFSLMSCLDAIIAVGQTV